jgi:hypothetical protein
MPGFTSQDDFINEVTVNGKFRRADWSKNITPVQVAGAWHFLAGLGGSPPATAYPGTSLLWRSTDDWSGDGTTRFGLQHGGGVLSDLKSVVNASVAMVAAAGPPGILMAVDMQGYYPLAAAAVNLQTIVTFINSDTTVASDSGGFILCTNTSRDFNSGTVVQFTTTGALPTNIVALTNYWLIRTGVGTYNVATSYANYVAGTKVAYGGAGSNNTMNIQMPRYANGAGCQAFMVCHTAPTAGGPNLTASVYTNSTPTGSRAFAGTTAQVATPTATRITHSAPATANMWGPFLPLQGGDSGIASVQSITCGSGTAYTGSGLHALVIARPLFSIPYTTSGLAAERDFVNQLPSLPRVVDGANICFLMGPTGGTTNLTNVIGHLDLAWG